MVNSFPINQFSILILYKLFCPQYIAADPLSTTLPLENVAPQWFWRSWRRTRIGSEQSDQGFRYADISDTDISDSEDPEFNNVKLASAQSLKLKKKHPPVLLQRSKIMTTVREQTVSIFSKLGDRWRWRLEVQKKLIDSWYIKERIDTEKGSNQT